MKSIRRLVAIGSALALFNACYAYKPLASDASPQVGELQRFNLTIDGTVELARYLGPNVVQTEGTLTSVTDSSYIVDVDFVQTPNGIRQQWTGEGVVAIPKRYIAGTLRRTYQPRQTVLVTASTIVLLVVVAKIALNSGVLGGDGGPGGVINP